MCEVASVISDFCDPVDGSPLGSSVHGIPFFKISVIIFYNVPTGSKWLTSLEIRNGHSVLLTGFTTLLNVKPVFANLWSDVQLDVNFLISHLCVEINLIFYFFSYNILTCAFFNWHIIHLRIILFFLSAKILQAIVVTVSLSLKSKGRNFWGCWSFRKLRDGNFQIERSIIQNYMHLLAVTPAPMDTPSPSRGGCLSIKPGTVKCFDWGM